MHYPCLIQGGVPTISLNYLINWMRKPAISRTYAVYLICWSVAPNAKFWHWNEAFLSSNFYGRGREQGGWEWVLGWPCWSICNIWSHTLMSLKILHHIPIKNTVESRDGGGPKPSLENSYLRLSAVREGETGEVRSLRTRGPSKLTTRKTGREQLYERTAALGFR